MTDPERDKIAADLLALVFSLRAPDQTGEAWALNTISQALARAILASVGPSGEPDALLDLAAVEVRRIVTEAQSKFHRSRLQVPS